MVPWRAPVRAVTGLRVCPHHSSRKMRMKRGSMACSGGGGTVIGRRVRPSHSSRKMQVERGSLQGRVEFGLLACQAARARGLNGHQGPRFREAQVERGPSHAWPGLPLHPGHGFTAASRGQAPRVPGGAR